jgi:hypothetical protein
LDKTYLKNFGQQPFYKIFKIMKKVLYLFTLLFMAINIFSCNPESMADEVELQACCDGNGEIEPPLPPPPPTEIGNGG